MHTLANCIIHEQRQIRLRRIAMPHLQLKYIQANYVDDMHLLLQPNLANLLAAKIIFHEFNLALGLTI